MTFNLRDRFMTNTNSSAARMALTAALAAALTAFLTTTGCSSLRRNSEEQTAMQTQLSEMRTLLTQQNAQLESLEVKLSTLNQKLNEKTSEAALHSGSSAVDHGASRLKTTAIAPHPVSRSGTDVEATPASNDPEAGFVSDLAVGSFRQGKILFQAGKYPEAILAFSAFLERYPEHPLAGSAQFHIGDSYFKQGEFQLAVQEFQHVLTDHRLSPQVPDTLRQMALAEDALKKSEDAAQHRQTLARLFPQSPAAREMQNIPIPKPVPAAHQSAATHGAANTSASANPNAALDEPPATVPGDAQ